VKIYTRTGDRGDTGLCDGTRVPKSDPRVEACGDIDELNGWLGVVRAHPGLDADVEDILNPLQRDLFALGARLADPAGRVASHVEKAALREADVQRLEAWIDRLDSELAPLQRFLFPGGSPAGAALHLARAVCRRAERRIVALGADHVDAVSLAYINRLSDLLFVLARAVNRRAGLAETEW
jgi:cob(I)alamin adenosyltransferase